MQPQPQDSEPYQCRIFIPNGEGFLKRSVLLAILEYSAISMNAMLPAPVYGYDRKRTESRRVEGAGRSGYIITHRHGSKYQKQSVFAGGQPQSLPRPYDGYGAYATPDDFARGAKGIPIAYERLEGPSGVTGLPIIHHSESSSRKSSSKVSSSDFSDMDQRSPRSLTFGISLARSNPDKSSSVSLTQTSEPNLRHDGVKGSKKLIKGDRKGYTESIFSVLSSRYAKFLDLRMPIGAELVLQPPPRPTEKSLNSLLTWMYVL